MKKRNKLLAVLCLIIAAVCSFGLFACGKTKKSNHTHTPGEWVNTDPAEHYKLCTDAKCDKPQEKITPAQHDTKGLDGACSVCGYKAAGTTVHKHDWSDWTVVDDNKPTDEKEGKATRICEGGGICDAAVKDKERTLPVLTSNEYSKTADNATCSSGGVITCTYVIEDGVTVDFDVETPVKANAHKYGDEFTFDKAKGAEGHYRVCEYNPEHKTELEEHLMPKESGVCSECGFTAASDDSISPTHKECTFTVGNGSSAIVYGYSIAPAYYTYTYTGEKPITVSYKYYVLGDEDETTGTVTLSADGQHSFYAYLQTQATCTMVITSTETTAFTATLVLTRIGLENPSVEHPFTLDKDETIEETNYDGKKYVFTAEEKGWYVLACENESARVLLPQNNGKDERVNLPYAFSLDSGEKITFMMCAAVDRDVTYSAKIEKLTEERCGAIGHAYSSETVVPPTCTAGGYTTHTCDRCGKETKDNYTDANDHEYEWTVVDATCEKAGTKTGICSKCNNKVEETIEKKGHSTETATWQTVTAADCTNTGVEQLCCTVCLKPVETRTIPINEDAHDYGSYTYTDGTGHYKVCSYDNDHKTTVEAHDEKGEHGSCSECGYVPAHVHVWSDWTVDDNKPTKDKEGKATRTCTSNIGVCHAEDADKQHVLPVLTSDEYHTTPDTATCSATGKITYTYDIDGENDEVNESVSFDVETPINTSKHNYGSSYTYTDGTGHYRVCSYDHSHTTTNAAHNTSGANGSCSVCGYVPAHVHTWSDWTVDDNKPTETKEGKATRTCSSDTGICGATTADTEYVLPVLTSTDYTATADTATCSETGIITYTYDKDGVNVSFDVETPINEEAHDYGDYIKTDKNGHYKVCSYDNDHKTTVEAHDEDGANGSCTVCGYMPVHVHTWSAWTVTKNPTETEEGKATRTCTSDTGICGATSADKERVLPVLTSTDYTKTADTATCSAVGEVTFTYNKNNVKVSFTVETPINEDAHDYGDYDYADGTGHYQVCAHDPAHTTEVEAHNTDGEHGSCTVCGYMSEHKHTWSAWTVTKNPTETEEGKATRTCSSDTGICGATSADKERVLPVLTSTDYTKTADTATCSATGEVTYTYNKNNVKVSFTVETPINEDAHDYGDYDYTDGTGHYQVCAHDSSHTTEVEAHDTDGEHGSCTVCGYVPEHTHTWSAWTVTKNPTQTATGKATRTCTSDTGVCGATTADTEYTLPVLTSTDYTKTADTATCSAVGSVTYTYDKNGVSVSFTVATPKNDKHNYGGYTYTNGSGHYKVCSYNSAHKTTVETHDTDGEHGSCSVCGYVPAHVHVWSDWTVEGNKPTKDGEGKATRTCTSDTGICDATTEDTEYTLPVLTSSDYTKTADTATCSATGKITYTYSIDGASVSFDVATPVNAGKHNYGGYTYTDGTGHYKVCSYNNEHRTTVEAHNTNGANGSCTVCTYMPAHSHVWDAWTVTTANKPTETKEGKATRTCTSNTGVCGATTADKEYTLPALTSTDYAKTDDTATCSLTGKITYTYDKDGVSVSFDVATPVNASKHDYGSGYEYTDGTGHYKVCSYNHSHKTEIEAHDFEGEDGKCSVCEYVWPNMIMPTKVSYTFTVGQDSSATVYGYAPSAQYYTYTYKGEKAITVSYSCGNGENATAGTVTLSRDGQRSFTVYLEACGVCTMTITTTETTFSEPIKLTYYGATDPNAEKAFALNTEATVNTTYDGVKYTFTAATADWYALTCGANARVLLCNGDGTKQAVTLPYAFSLAANQTIAFMMCATGDSATYSATIAKLSSAQCTAIFGSHDYTDVVTAPTCTAGGYTTHTCSRCGHSYSDGNTDKLDHDYEWTVVSDSTCTQVGRKNGTCSRCGDKVYDVEIEMKAHSTEAATWETVKAATCSHKGEERLRCTVCNNTVQTRETPIDSAAHNYAITVIKKPTLTEKGTAQLVCNHNEAHKSTSVTLPMLASTSYTVSESGQFRNYTIETAIGEVSFSIELEEIKTVEKAIEYAINTSGMIVDSRIDFSLNAVQGGGGGIITYEIGDKYVHAKDGYMNTERWITLKDDGTFFALIEKEDRNDQIHVMLDPSACIDDFKGYAFRFVFAQQEWEMAEVYGVAQFIDVLYKFASQNPNSIDFTQSITTEGGKTYYRFSYKFIDADPHDNTDMNHGISVEFTLNGDYFIDYCKLTGTSRRGKTIGSGDLLATQTFTVTQHSRRGVGEQAPVNPWHEDTIALTDYKLQYVASVDEALENIVLAEGYFPINGENNTLGTIGYGKTYQLQLVEYQPTQGVNFRYDEIKFYLRAKGESGLGVLLDGSYKDGDDGHVLASYDPISRLVSLGFYLAGEYDLILKTVKTEKVVSFNIPYETPTSIGAYVYIEDELSGTGNWQSDQSEFEIATGYSVIFYGRVPLPGKQYSQYTVTVTKDGAAVNGVLTAIEKDGVNAYEFTPAAVGTYTITLTTTHGDCTKTLTVQVMNVPDSDYIKGKFANDFKQISLTFDASQSRFTLTVGETTGVYDYTLNVATFNATLFSGTYDEFRLYFNSANELIFEQNGEKSILFKEGEANAILGTWSVPKEFKVNVSGEYNFSFNEYTYTYLGHQDYSVGCSIDDGDPFIITGPTTLTLKSGQIVSFNTTRDSVRVTVVENIPVTGVTLSESSKELFIGDAFSLLATITPSGATNTMKTWTSSDESVATVTVSGYVVAVGAGTATITVTTKDGDFTATCTVTVNTHASGVTLNKSSHTMYLDDTLTLTATVSPATATYKDVTWTSSDPAVATVVNGVVTAIGKGTTTITATTVDGGFTATCEVTVNVHVTGVTLNKTTDTVIVGDTLTLTATVLPANANNKNVTWSSSNEAVATVENGVVTAKSEGTTTITVTTADGSKTASCVITVNRIAVTGVTLDTSSETIYMNDTLTLTATVSPSNATYKTVTWTSSNEAVATVENGVVTPVGAGTTTITVTTEDGGFYKTCTVTVAGVELTAVAINPTTLSLYVGQIENIAVTFTPANASYTSKTWTSSNGAVATVDNNGKVTAVGAGNATITLTVVTATDTFTKTCSVSVSRVAVGSVTLDTAMHTLNKGDAFTLTATVLPENATNKTVTWTSSNEAVATVVNGVVTAVGGGSATITVTTEDGNKTARCSVTVNVPVIGVALNETSYSIDKGETFTLTATVSPDDATNKNVSWSTSNPAVATVENGVVTAVGGGTATITVTTVDGGKTATCNITVNVPVTGVTLSESGKEVVIGNSFTLTATVAPADASNTNVTWTSSNEDVATVVNGVVTAVGEGTATITVTTADGGKTASCTVTVTITRYGVGEYAFSYATTTSTTFILDGEVGASYNLTVYYGATSGTYKDRTYLYNDFYVDGVLQNSFSTASLDLVLENNNTKITIEKHNAGTLSSALKLVISKTVIEVGEAMNLDVLSTTGMAVKLSGCVAGEEYKVTALQGGVECNTVNIQIKALNSAYDSLYNYGNATFTYQDGMSLYLMSGASGGLAGITVMLQKVVNETVEHNDGHQLLYTSKDDYTHTVICTVAGCNYVVSEGDHVYDGGNDDTCNLCGHVRHTSAHTLSYTSKDDRTHTVTCSVNGCSYLTEESHVQSDAGICELCYCIFHTGAHTLSYTSKDDYSHTVICTVAGCNHVETEEFHRYDDDNDETCNDCGYIRDVGSGSYTLAVGGQLTVASLDWSGITVQLTGCVVGKEYKVSALQYGVTCNDVSITIPAIGIYFGYYGEITFTYSNGAAVMLSAPSGTLTNVVVTLERSGIDVSHTDSHELKYTPNGESKHTVSCTVAGCDYVSYQEDHDFVGDTCSLCGYTKGSGGIMKEVAVKENSWDGAYITVESLNEEGVTLVLQGCREGASYSIYASDPNTWMMRDDIEIIIDGQDATNYLTFTYDGTTNTVVIRSKSGTLNNVEITVYTN